MEGAHSFVPCLDSFGVISQLFQVVVIPLLAGLEDAGVDNECQRIVVTRLQQP